MKAAAWGTHRFHLFVCAMDMYQLVYQSQSLVPFEPLELTTLLRHSCANNNRHGITGILLYTPDGRFLQVLEGPQQAVRHLYFDVIMADPRHYDCRVLSEGPCPRRSFTGWDMAFKAAQARDLRRLLAPVPPDSPALLVPRPRTRPELMALLLKFATNRETAVYVEQPSS